MLLFGVSLQPTNIHFRSYSGDKISVLGKASGNVKANDQSTNLSLIVVEGQGVALLGRERLKDITLPWKNIVNGLQVNHIDMKNQLNELFAQTGSFQRQYWSD